MSGIGGAIDNSIKASAEGSIAGYAIIALLLSLLYPLVLGYGVKYPVEAPDFVFEKLGDSGVRTLCIALLVLYVISFIATIVWMVEKKLAHTSAAHKAGIAAILTALPMFIAVGGCLIGIVLMSR